MVRLIHKDHIEEIIREGIKPTIFFPGNLLNIRNCYVGVEDVIDVNTTAFYYCSLGILLRCTNYMATVIKIRFAVCSKIVAELGSNPRAGSNNKCALALKRIR